MSTDPAHLIADNARIDPAPTLVTLRSGMQVELTALKTRQLFRLLKIITHGSRLVIAGGFLDLTADAEQFGSRLATLVLLSIPDAEQETLDFVQSMCRPVGSLPPDSVVKYSKQQLDADKERWAELGAVLYNPDPEDLVTLIEAIVANEASDLQALGKRLFALAQPFLKAGADKEGLAENPPAEEVAAATAQPAAQDFPGVAVRPLPVPLPVPLPEVSPPPSTSSAPSTAGAMTKSSASPSAASARSRQPSPSASAPSS